jgi:hypothetical protein
MVSQQYERAPVCSSCNYSGECRVVGPGKRDALQEQLRAITASYVLLQGLHEPNS